MRTEITFTEEQRNKLLNLRRDVVEEYARGIDYEPSVTDKGWWIFKSKSYDWSSRPEMKYHDWYPSYHEGFFVMRNFKSESIIKVCDCLSIGNTVTLNSYEAALISSLIGNE